MNLALQKRHEQLERWRQNEANAELIEKQQQAAGKCNNNNTKKSIQNISSTSSYDNERNNNNQYNISSTTSSNTKRTDANNNNSSKRNKKNSADLQVKFTNSTLFLTACANGDLAECERLINDKLIDIDVTTCDGLTGLHEAAICGNKQMVEYLLKNGANINCCDNEGWTPLHAAASLGQVETVELLLDYGADVTIVNCENFLAYDLARNDQVKDLIGDKLQDIDLDYLHTQEERLIERDIDRWIQTGHYEERSHPITNATVLHVLAAKGYIKLMKRILETPKLKKQVNLEAKDNEGFTPLLAASFWNQNEIVELLIDHGANTFAQANNGYQINSIIILELMESLGSMDWLLVPMTASHSID